MVKNGEVFWFPLLPAPSENIVGEISVEKYNNKLKIRFNNQELQNLKLNVALLGFNFDTYIERGENASKKLKEDFVLLEFQQYNKQESNNNWIVDIPKNPKNIKPEQYALSVWITKGNDTLPIQSAGNWIQNEWVENN